MNPVSLCFAHLVCYSLGCYRQGSEWGHRKKWSLISQFRCMQIRWQHRLSILITFDGPGYGPIVCCSVQYRVVFLRAGQLHQHRVHCQEAWWGEGRALPDPDRHVQLKRARGVPGACTLLQLPGQGFQGEPLLLHTHTHTHKDTHTYTWTHTLTHIHTQTN